MSGRLTSAIAAFYTNDSGEARLEVLDALYVADLIVPAAERKDVDSPLRLAFTADAAGKPLLPSFTDLKHFAVWLPAGGPWAKASGYVIAKPCLPDRLPLY